MSEPEFKPPQWDVPGWDWGDGDYAWLNSESGLYDPETQTSVFFIHGGRIRHQSHIPHGLYTLAEFQALWKQRAGRLDDPRLVWSEDTGDGDAGLWIEGTRAPDESDLARLQAARARALHADRIGYMSIRKRHPEWFTPDVELDEYGRPPGQAEYAE
jgi:hypothetical protein